MGNRTKQSAIMQATFKNANILLIACLLVKTIDAQVDVVFQDDSPCRDAGVNASVPHTPLGKAEMWPIVYAGNQVMAAAPPVSYCCKKGDLTRWSIAQTTQFGWLASVGASCSDNEKLPEIKAGKNDQNPCSSVFRPAAEIDNPNDGHYTAQTGWAIEGFLIKSNDSKKDEEGFSCPRNMVAIGFSARSQCLSLVELRVLCAPSRVYRAPPPSTSAFTGNQQTVQPKKASHYPIGLVALWIAIGFAVANGVVLGAVYLIIKRRRQTIICVEGGSGLPYERFPDASRSSSGRLSTGSSEIELPSYKELDHMEFVDLNHVTVAHTNSTTMDTLPDEFKSYGIAPSDLTITAPNGCPVTLGGGGFGRVILGTYLGSPAAIKILKGGTPERQAQFLHEISILEKCRYKHICSFYGYSLLKDKLALVMEYYDDKSLYERIQMLRDPNMQWYKRGKEIMHMVALGLNFLHSKKIVHLDLKSPNILLGSDGTAVIADVGLGRLVADATTFVTAPKSASPLWKAPEIEHGIVGQATDIFAFGTILWEVCTMKKPEARNCPPISCPEEAPKGVSEMITRCRKYNPDARPRISEICEWFKSI